MDFNLNTLLKSKITWTIATVITSYFILDKYKSRKRRIFVSYHSIKDANYKTMLNAWKMNDNFAFDFDDHSVGISINSEDESYIKKVITDRLHESNLVLCIIGKKTYERPFIDWELQKAKKLNKKIIAVKIKNNYKAPKCLLNSNIKFYKFSKENTLKDFVTKERVVG